MGLEFPNGTVITPDGGTLIVAEAIGRRLTAFDISADGGLSNQRVWADLKPHQIAPDGICLDASGAMWSPTPQAILMFRVAEGGELLDTVGFSQPCVACMLGGPDGRELFAMTAPGVGPGAGFRVAAGADRVSPRQRRPRRTSVIDVRP